MPLEAGLPAITVNQLSADQWRPLSRVMQLDRSVFLTQLQQIREFNVPAVDGPPAGDGPVLDVAPTSVDSFWTTSQDPTEYFVPAVEIARRSPTSAVPAVYVDRGAGAGALRGVLDFPRHPSFAPSGGAPPPAALGGAGGVRGPGGRGGVAAGGAELPPASQLRSVRGDAAAGARSVGPAVRAAGGRR